MNLRLFLLGVGLLLGCTSDPADKSPADGDEGKEQTDDSPAAERDAGSMRDASRRDGATGDDASSPSDQTKPDAAALADAGSSMDASMPDTSGFDWVAGDYPPDLMEWTYLELKDLPGQSGPRGFKVHVPKSYDRARPMPVLFALHGLGQNAVMFVVQGTSFVSLSESEGFILVMPNGVDSSWNGGVCCGTAAAAKLDDVGFIRAVFAEVAKHLHVDRARVYATGLSNGAFMTWRLGCEAADLFAAIAPLAGSIGTAELGSIGTNFDPDLMRCEPSRPVSVLAMHGDGDPIVPYSGMKPSLDHWAKEVGCGMTTSPASVPKSGGDTTCTTYASCPSGTELTSCTVKAGGHCWFGDEGCGTGAPGIGNLIVGNNSDFLNASDAAWAFLSRIKR